MNKYFGLFDSTIISSIVIYATSVREAKAQLVRLFTEEFIEFNMITLKRI